MTVTPREVRTLLRRGEPDRVVALLAEHPEALNNYRRSMFLFDAFWALGQLPEALDQLEKLHLHQSADARTADRFEMAYQHTNDRRWNPLDLAPDLSTVYTEPETNRIAELLVRLRDVDGCERLLEQAANSEPLSPRLALRLARVKYLQNNFGASEAIAGDLITTDVSVAARRLLRTLAFRRGEFEPVLDSTVTSLTEFDHLRYNALLASGRLGEAFAMMPFPDDLARVVSVFLHANEHAAAGAGSQTGILSESGPGDQLVDVVALSRVSAKIGTPVMTVDPRLTSILRRSYPDVTFVASSRLDRSALGHLAAGHDRATGELVDLLTTESCAALSSCNIVVLARSLKSLLDLEEPPGQRHELIPDPRLVSELSDLAAGQIGFCWRSEKQNPWRDMNYVAATDLGPLLSTGHRFVCLQHDATEDERATVQQLAGGRVTFVDSIDMRDDFERTAALVANLRCVVGPGTTMTVLAAALSTPTLIMHPTSFGRWLARSTVDFWFSSREHVEVTHDQTTKQLIELAGDALRRRVPLDGGL